MKVGELVEKYKLLKKLSKCVWKVEHSTTNNTFVMKVFYKNDEHGFNTELAYNKSICDKIIFAPRSAYYGAIIMTLFPETLHTFIIKIHKALAAEKKTPKLIEIADICTCKLRAAMEKMHIENCMHLDIKPDNIVLTESAENILNGADYDVQFIDYEFADKIRTGHTMLLGTNAYSAPEILMCEKYTHACDIWSLGCCIYELYADERLADYDVSSAVLDEIEKMLGPISSKYILSKFRTNRIRKQPNYLLNRLQDCGYKPEDAKKIETTLATMLRYKKRTL